MPRRRLVAALGAITAAAAIGPAACGGGDGGDSEKPGGTYTGNTRQGLRVTLTVSGGAVRRASVRLKGSGPVVAGQRCSRVSTAFGSGGPARIAADGRFSFRPVRKRRAKRGLKSRSYFALEGRFRDATKAVGTFRHRVRLRFKLPGQRFELSGGQVATPTQVIRLTCGGGRLRFTARRR